MKQLVFAALLSVSLSSCAQPAATPQASAVPTAATPQNEPAFAAGTPEARAREALRALNPRVQVERIGEAPIAGFREVVAGGQVVYVSDDGKYIFQGGLLDVDKGLDLSERAMAKLRKQVLATLPESDRIVFAPKGVTRHTVVVLTDVECGYCRKFHSDIAQYTGRGIRVEYLAFPRAGLGSPDYQEMVAVWCAPDRQKALTDAKNGQPPAPHACTRTPVDMQYRAGLRMGLEGTPMILTDDGRLVGGYLPPDRLLLRLDAMDKDQAAG
ncbi:DsbC family protein [Thermomonas paludicola]|uniref:DsbC family protein n=1 Tax=Thermomonas paludicola TaxID=2884874 RepID=UPI0021140582|nr:DsbC family protein [Thermomonas paludicola]